MPATQYAYRQYAGNGSTTTFAVPFPYLLKAHVKVYTGYDLATGSYASLLVDGTGYTWTSATQIQTTTAPAAGVTLTVIRQTPSSTQLVQWQDGSNLVASDIDTADKQNLYVTQEQFDKTEAIATQSQLAKSSADAALASVTNALPYPSIANVAAIPALPANDARVEVLDTTGIESFTPLSGLPAGFIGSSSAKARLVYSSTASSWSWIDYALNDPLNLFVQKSSVSSSTTSTSTTTVANSLAVKTAKDAADAALPKAGGTMTGPVVFAGAQPTATTAAAGIVQLTDSTNSTSITTAATPNSVKTVADAATAALPKAGGTMTGPIVFAGAQPTATTSAAGIVQLTDSTSSASTTTAATPNSVKTVADTASAALPKAGGTMTGSILSPSGTVTAPSLSVGTGTTTPPGLFSPGTNQVGLCASGAEQWRTTDTGTFIYNLPAPAAVNATATLTVGNLTAKIITSTTAAAVTMTLPTGALMDAAFSSPYVGMTFEWSVVNTGTVNAATIAAGASHTIVGLATVAANSATRFASRRTGVATWVTYRVA